MRRQILTLLIFILPLFAGARLMAYDLAPPVGSTKREPITYDIYEIYGILGDFWWDETVVWGLCREFAD